jgi:hypothetical protein
MRKFALIALGVVAVLLIVACAVVALQPADFAIQRSIQIAATPGEVFSHVNDLQAWDAWSPWSKLDPDAKVTLSDPAAGKGASIHWSGNDQVGEGNMVIVESRPAELVDLEQTFVRPMAGSARIAYDFAPEADGTKVTMRMTGKNGFLAKAMCLVMNMEKMIGPKFDEALAGLKKVAEGHEPPATPVEDQSTTKAP